MSLRMFCSCGPDGVSRCARSSSRSTRSVFRSRKPSGPSSSRPARSNRSAQRLAGDRAPAEPGDHRAAAERGCAVQRLVDVGGDDPAAPDRQRLLEDHHAAGAGERLADLVEREGAERLDAEGADPDAALAQLIDHRLDRPQNRAERDDDRVGALGPVAAQQAAGGTAEVDREALGDLGDHVEGLHLLGVGEVLDLEEGLRPDHGADRYGLGRVEDLAGLERRNEVVDRLLVRDVDLLVGVGEDESVHADHHRQRHSLRDPERLDVHVDSLLVGLGVELDPARVALGHRVRVVVPDIDRGADRAVGDRHHDRQAEAGGVVERLDHVEQALAGGGGVGAGAGRRGADRGRHRRELGLDHQVLAGSEVAGPDHVGEVLDDVRLRGDRIGADHLRAAERDGLGDGPRSLLLPKHGPAPRLRPAPSRARGSPRRRSSRQPSRRTFPRSPWPATPSRSAR